jgi:uncharacterized protein (DUF58 family)
VPEGSGAPQLRSPWRTTHAFLRGSIMTVVLLLVGLLFHQPDLVVLATPFLIVTTWSLVRRPTADLAVRYPRAAPILREGDAMIWAVELGAAPFVEQAAIQVDPGPFQQLRPRSGVRIASIHADDAVVDLSVQARTTRWGIHELGRSSVSATSAWGAHRWGPVTLPPVQQTTRPLPAVFDGRAPAPHPAGLVGINRSARGGEGSEFATIRPFQLGDRLRRVHWPVSLRSQTLHVATTYADQDAEVMVIVDSSSDLGESAGIDGQASSLDLTVRAAGAIAEHFVSRGDRVGLTVFGQGVARLAPAAGRQHLWRILVRLAGTAVGNSADTSGRLLRLRLGPDAMVVMMSACLSRLALDEARTLAGRGATLVVVDTLPTTIGGLADVASLAAWRIRRLERDTELRELRRAGVPIVAWRGPGSLDQVLRDLRRHGSSPRVTRR